MMRHLVLGVLFAVSGLAAPSNAQQLHIGFDRHGVKLGGEVQFGGRRGPAVRIGNVCEPRDTVCYEYRSVRVWVPGCRHIERVPAAYGWVTDRCGRMVWTCITPAYDRVVEEPGHWEWQRQQVPVIESHRHHF